MRSGCFLRTPMNEWGIVPLTIPDPILGDVVAFRHAPRTPPRPGGNGRRVAELGGSASVNDGSQIRASFPSDKRTLRVCSTTIDPTRHLTMSPSGMVPNAGGVSRIALGGKMMSIIERCCRTCVDIAPDHYRAGLRCVSFDRPVSADDVGH